MRLCELIDRVNVIEIHADTEMNVSGIECDSRKVKKGDLFVAVKGYESDGHRFIGKAAENGAVCIICEEKPEIDIPYVIVENSRRAVAVASSNFFRNPSSEMTVIGVTGTNGKTTVTTLLKQIIEKVTGEKVGLIGTNKNMIGNQELETERTTPDSYELQKLFRQMADENVKYVVMEVSSHALYLDRVYGVKFAIGAFTNLTEDHLDFHKTMEEYAKAKAILFSMCEKAVINMDDPYSQAMIDAATCPVFTFSAKKNEADLVAKDIHLLNDGISFCAVEICNIEKVRLGIPGMFSVYNALAAIAVAENLKLNMGDIVSSLSECEGVKGRAEVVPVGKDYTVLIDYAHTPDALKNILDTVNGFAKGKTIVVFGCGGDREHEKRPVMGKIASENADMVIVTSDNPRTEVPSAIIDEIVSGIPKSAKNYKVIENRREAIGYAMEIAKAGDVIILAGKGHETYQIIGKEKTHFDEREVVMELARG